MATNLRNINCIIFIAFIIIIYICPVFSFYSSYSQKKDKIKTGSVEASISNLNVNYVDYHEPTEEFFLEVNTSAVISFTVSNSGLSRISYYLDIDINWLDDLPAIGKFFVYPYESNDYEIHQSILEEGDSGGGDEGGVAQSLDYDVLESPSSDSQEGFPTSKDYRFRLYFFADEEILADPQLFHDKTIEVKLKLLADVEGVSTGWQTTQATNFYMQSYVDFTKPIITEILQPKIFFIGTGNDINLADYVSAYDENDGDISHRINISSSPEFDPMIADTYTITYNVTNTEGIPALPLHINITIWDFVKTASGNFHTLALTSHGKVYAWGRNVEGQLGDGTSISRNTPKVIEGLNDIIDIAACNSSSFALKSDGQLYSWGHNGYGHLGDGTIKDKKIPDKVIQPDDVKFVAVSSRFNTAGAITEDGEVYTWGYGRYGANGRGTNAEDANPYPQKLEGLENIVSLTFGKSNGAAITSAGELYVFGSNGYGQLGIGANVGEMGILPTIVPYFASNNIRVAKVSFGAYHSMVVSEDGRLYTMGQGYQGSLGDGGTSYSATPIYIPMPESVSGVGAGNNHSVLFTESGSVYVFGTNDYGKIGMGDVDRLLLPTILEGVTDARYISQGDENTLIISGGKTLFAMGLGEYGALGNGYNVNSNVPSEWIFALPPPIY